MQAGFVAGLVGAVVIGLAAPAWPCFAIVSGTTSCSGGFHVVHWSVGNGPAGGTMLIEDVLAQADLTSDVYPVTGTASTVPQSGATTGQSTVAGWETGHLTLDMNVQWPQDNFQTMTSGFVDLGADVCPGSLPPPTTTTTTTTSPTTTTTYPTTTTTTPYSTTTTTTSPTTTTTTQPYGPPPTCQDLKAYSGDGRAVVRWSVSGDSNSQTPIVYLVTPFEGVKPLRPRIFFSANTSDVVTGLHNGQTYRFTVAAITQNWTGAASEVTRGVTVGTPGSPSAVTATGRGASATVHWKAPASTNGAPVLEYIVTPYRNGVAQRSYVLAARTRMRAHGFVTRATTLTISGLTAGQKYTFKVAAKNARGVGRQSSTSNLVIHKVKAHADALTSAAASAVVQPLQAVMAWLG